MKQYVAALFNYIINSKGKRYVVVMYINVCENFKKWRWH